MLLCMLFCINDDWLVTYSNGLRSSVNLSYFSMYTSVHAQHSHYDHCIHIMHNTREESCVCCHMYSLLLFLCICIHPPSATVHFKDGMNALHLAICGNHADVVKVLIDEFNVAMMPKGPVSSQSFKHKLSHE